MREVNQTATEEETRAVGADFAKMMKAGDVVYLHGDLGTGKTAFVKGVVAEMHKALNAKSPTFSIMNEYPVEAGAIRRVLHLDLYRLRDPEELLAIDFHAFMADSVFLIEWPEKGEGFLPGATERLFFTHSDVGGRTITRG